LPRHFGRYTLLVERRIYEVMSQFSPTYSGGCWPVVYAETAHVVAAMMDAIVEKLDPLNVRACTHEPDLGDAEPTS
jgi:hypothetical protein